MQVKIVEVSQKTVLGEFPLQQAMRKMLAHQAKEKHLVYKIISDNEVLFVRFWQTNLTVGTMLGSDFSTIAKLGSNFSTIASLYDDYVLFSEFAIKSELFTLVAALHEAYTKRK